VLVLVLIEDSGRYLLVQEAEPEKGAHPGSVAAPGRATQGQRKVE